MSWLTAFVSACILATQSTPISAPSTRHSERFEPNPSVQAVFDRIARTFPSGLQDPLKPDDAQELLQLCGSDRAAIVRQAIYYYGHHQFEGPEIDVPQRVLDHFQVRPEEYVEALVPLLEGSDSDLTELARDQLLGADWHNPRNSFDTLAGYLAGHDKVPDSFIASMFRLSPGEALSRVGVKYLTDRERWRQLIWADHIVADAVWKREHDFLQAADVEAASAQLEMLSKFDEWWVRRYVVEMLVRQPLFRRDEIVQRLRNDPHPLVRAAIQRMDNERTSGKQDRGNGSGIDQRR